MWLLFDIGNTRLKWRWADSRGIFDGGAVPLPHEGEERELFSHTFSYAVAPERIVVSNVAGKRFEESLGVWSRQHWGIDPHVVISEANAYGVQNGYAQPSTLGVDRWCGLIGARGLMHGSLCVVDCGTAVTVDALANNGEHLGGLILPGIRAMVRAVTNSAQGIPSDLAVGTTTVSLGKTTAECIYAGAVTAIAGAIDLSVCRLGPNASPQVVLTGGDASAIAKEMKAPSLIEPELVFKGLARIAQEL